MQGITDAAHLAFRFKQQAEHAGQGRDRRLAVPGLQLHPQHPPFHKFLHGCEGTELEAAMRTDHHHAPVTISGLLLEKAAGFGIEPQ